MTAPATPVAPVSLKGVLAKHATAHVQAKTGPGVIIKGQVAPMLFKITDLEPDFQAIVYGSPAPKGSLEYKGHRNGKPILGTAADGEKAWERAVRAMARQFVISTPGWQCINETVFIAMSFSMPMTDAARKRGDTDHEDVPDSDKLARATIDGLCAPPIPASEGKHLPEKLRKQVREQMREQARRFVILHDDKLANGFLVTEKVYVGTTETALTQPGAVIQLWRKSRLA